MTRTISAPAPALRHAPAAIGSRRYEALLLALDADAPQTGALGRLIERACRAGLHLVILAASGTDALIAAPAARAGPPGSLLLLADGATGRRPGLEGLEPCGPLPADPRAAAEAHLSALGIARSQTLAVAPWPGAETGRGGTIAAVVEDQIARRARGEPPVPPDDVAWTVAIDEASPATEGARESLLTIADGRFGTRGSAFGAGPGSDPAVLAGGVYAGTGAESRLVRAPLWNRLADAAPVGTCRRVLDLRTGVLHEHAAGPAPRTAVMFTSTARPGIAALRATLAGLEPGPPLAGPGVVVSDALRAEAEVAPARGGVAAVAVQRFAAPGVVERIAAYRSHPHRRPGRAPAHVALAAARAPGWEALLNEQRAAMGRRWAHAGIRIDGDPVLDRAVRFCLFHLMTSVADRGEAAVGARGLSGPDYRGHVFWDADVFVLPFLAATHPRGARAMLEYRLRRLAAARREAATEGRAGAHMPWESAATGEEVAPTRGRDPRGRFTSIRTGELEEHIVSDVAWAAWCHAAWNGGARFLRGRGRPLVVDTARWWADRIELDADGSAHIRGVAGPDEYHWPVDDDAFTNGLVRWHLRLAADVAGEAPHEAERWRALADALVDNLDPSTGVYEQFAGFHALDPLIIADVAARRPVAASLLLGDRGVARAQVLKQADVLMLHHLLPDAVAPGTLAANLDFYEPRTAHGSSLSPGVHAALMARAGRPDAARDLLETTALLDLEDLTQTTAGGLHLAAMGSVWQAVAWGFAGLWPQDDALRIAPSLPRRWSALEVRVRFRGANLRIELTADDVTVDADRTTRLRIGGGEPRAVRRGRTRIPLREAG